MNLWQHLSAHISQQTDRQFDITSHNTIGGGCINEVYRVSNESQHYFVKLNSLHHGDMFETEALSLNALSATATVQVPNPVCFGQTHTQAYLVLEYLPLSGRPNSELLGQQLAALHRNTGKEFGWLRDNTIGSTHQANQPTQNWVDFWREQRLLPQINLAEKNGYASTLSPLTDKLISRFGSLFDDYSPAPSMLHGDLWGGNAAGLADGTPVIFDPAFYYGDREADIAMTHLFGGFDARFYAAYNEAWPLDAGFAVRKTFYNLYHILNHLNLFGSGYLQQTVSMTEQILAEI